MHNTEVPGNGGNYAYYARADSKLIFKNGTETYNKLTLLVSKIINNLH